MPNPPLNLVDAVASAAARLAPYELRTPVVAAPGLGRSTWFKCENLQRTGSFKLRGALNKVLSLSTAERTRGVVTSSTGNHGLAVAEALRLVGGSGTVVVSEMAAPYKVQRLRAGGLRVIVHAGDPMAAELEARALAGREEQIYISPYNDPDVAAGQGTIGVELLDQIPDLEAVYVAVGGGGLVSGLATALKAAIPALRVVGCWPGNAPAMYENMRAGRIYEVHEQPTLSDATAGNLEPGAITLPLCERLIDDCVLVTEEEIAGAMRDVALGDHLVIEGAAGVAVAAHRRHVREQPHLATRRSAVILCGGNVSAERLRDILAPPATAPHG
jgi:threonine dehydratase